MIGEIKYAYSGVKLNAPNFPLLHEYPHRDVFAPHITCVIDDTLLKTMLDINQVLLRYRRHELGRLAAALLPIFCSQASSDLYVGFQRSGEIKAGLVSVVPGG